jgi:hypothetical protein
MQHVLKPHHHWQIFIHAKLPLMIKTCDIPTELGPDYMGSAEEVQSLAA